MRDGYVKEVDSSNYTRPFTWLCMYVLLMLCCITMCKSGTQTQEVTTKQAFRPRPPVRLHDADYRVQTRASVAVAPRFHSDGLRLPDSGGSRT